MKLKRLTILLSAALAALAAVVSCSKTESPSPVPEQAGEVALHVTGEFNDFSTKASIENVFRMTWAQSDVVYVYGKASGSSSFSCLGSLSATPDESAGGRVADLTGTITAPVTGTKLTLVYSPSLSSAPTVDDGSVSIDLSSQSGDATSVTFVAFTAVDYSGSSASYRSSFSFATSVLRVNVCDLTADTGLTQAALGEMETGCKLTLSDSSVPSVSGVGSGTITRTLSDCSANSKGTAAFYIAVPSISANADRTLTVTQQNSSSYEYAGFATGSKSAGSMMNSIARMGYGSFNLSASGTANCYVVPGIGNYKFKATVKGNSNESVGTPASVAVLWESFGTAVTPAVGDLVKNVKYADDYVNFTATDKKGNAVIAVKNNDGIILWSWHIWLTDALDTQGYDNGAGTVMDRNLGATSATPGDVRTLGLLYQWGRKDPFLSGKSITSSTAAASTLTWPDPEESDVNTGTIDYAIAYPTTFLMPNGDNNDWYYTGGSSTDNTRWQTSDDKKGLYDPCPQGWRVPDGGSSGVWSSAFGASSTWTASSGWDSTNMGMDFGNTDKTLGTGFIWYPAAGVIGSKGALEYVKTNGNYWSSTPYEKSGEEHKALYLYFKNNSVSPSGSRSRATGCSVRCVSD